MLRALAFGLPLGGLLGRWAWFAFAHQLGVATDATFLPAAMFVIVGAVALGLALLAAVVPATIAARTRSTRVLHGE